MSGKQYNLPFTAEQIKEKLKNIQDGGLGYIEQKVNVLMPETVIPMYLSNTEEPENSSALYDLGFDLAIFGGGREGTVYIDGVKYFAQVIKGTIKLYTVDGRGCEFGPHYDGSTSVLCWTGEVESAPETITVSIEEHYDVAHRINEDFLPEGYEGLPAKVALLQTGGVLVEKGEYPFEPGSVMYGDGTTAYLTSPGAYSLVPTGTTLKVHFDGTDYVCRTTFASLIGIAIFGNITEDCAAGTTGEPFYGAIVPAGTISSLPTDFILLCSLDTAETHIVGISLANAGTAGGGNAGGMVATLNLTEMGYDALGAVMAGGGEAWVEHTDWPNVLTEASKAEIVKLRFALPGGSVFDSVCRSVSKSVAGFIEALDGVCVVNLTTAGAGVLEVKMQIYPTVNNADSNPHYATTVRVNIAVAPL